MKTNNKINKPMEKRIKSIDTTPCLKLGLGYAREARIIRAVVRRTVILGCTNNMDYVVAELAREKTFLDFEELIFAQFVAEWIQNKASTDMRHPAYIANGQEWEALKKEVINED